MADGSDVKRRKLSLKKFKQSSNGNTSEIKSNEETTRDVSNNMYIGLINLGNTCYINAVIQVLRYCPGVVEQLAIIKNEKPTNTDDQIAKEFNELILLMLQSNDKMIVDPSNFVHKIQETFTFFEKTKQHDSQEFLTTLFHSLQHVTLDNRKRQCSDELPNAPPPKLPRPIKITEFFSSCPPKRIPKVTCLKEDIISKLFEGTLAFETKCLLCENKVVRKEPFTHLSIPVTNRDSLQCGPYSLHWSLSQFASIDYLRDQNKYSCDKCNHLTEAKHSVTIGHLPSTMILHFNRFSTHSSYLSVSKTTGTIAIPLNISFTSWCAMNCPNRSSMYSLFAVIFHTGQSCNTGHYTTAIKRSFIEETPSNIWALFDDETVSLLTNNQFQDLISPLQMTCTPYILFYTSKC